MSVLRRFSTAERLMILAAIAALLLASRWPAAGACLEAVRAVSTLPVH